MLEREALRWEQRHLDGCQRAVGSSDASLDYQSDEAEEQTTAPPLSLVRRRDEFPLWAFLKAGDGLEGEGGEQRPSGSDLPELVREELLHRFIMGEFR